MLKLYHAWTPNVIKVSLALEEMGLPYERVPVDIAKGEQMTPAFLAVSPNNKVPALTDDDVAEEGRPLAIFESGAILIYLAERTGRFLPLDARARAAVLQWLMWQMAGFGPMLGQTHHFLHFSTEVDAYAIARFATETARLYGVLEKQLAGQDFIAGAYSIADMACWPWLIYHDLHNQNLESYPNVAAWFGRISNRPAARASLSGMKMPVLALKPEVAALPLRHLMEMLGSDAWKCLNSWRRLKTLNA